MRPPFPQEDPTVALCLGTYGDPRGVGVFYEQGTPVQVYSSATGVSPKCNRPNGPRRARPRLQDYLAIKKTPTPLGPP